MCLSSYRFLDIIFSCHLECGVWNAELWNQEIQKMNSNYRNVIQECLFQLSGTHLAITTPLKYDTRIKIVCSY